MARGGREGRGKEREGGEEGEDEGDNEDDDHEDYGLGDNESYGETSLKGDTFPVSSHLKHLFIKSSQHAPGLSLAPTGEVDSLSAFGTRGITSQTFLTQIPKDLLSRLGISLSRLMKPHPYKSRNMVHRVLRKIPALHTSLVNV